MFTSALTGGNPKVPSSLNIPGDLKKSIFSTASGRPPRSILGLPLIPKSLFHFYENAASSAEQTFSSTFAIFLLPPSQKRFHFCRSPIFSSTFAIKRRPPRSISGLPLIPKSLFHLYENASTSAEHQFSLPLLPSSSLPCNRS